MNKNNEARRLEQMKAEQEIRDIIREDYRELRKKELAGLFQEDTSHTEPEGDNQIAKRKIEEYVEEDGNRFSEALWNYYKWLDKDGE